jgi:hypothetical protein
MLISGTYDSQTIQRDELMLYIYIFFYNSIKLKKLHHSSLKVKIIYISFWVENQGRYSTIMPYKEVLHCHLFPYLLEISCETLNLWHIHHFDSEKYLKMSSFCVNFVSENLFCFRTCMSSYPGQEWGE